MQLIRGLYNLTEQYRGCALTIGNFDGVHLGHLQVLNRLRQDAEQRRLKTCIMSFEPLPQEYFNLQSAPPRLLRLREKWCALQDTQIDYFLCARFNHAMAELSADEFIKQILVDRLDVKYLLVGDDFRFGRQRCGNFETLQQAGKTYGFEVYNTSSHCYEGERISSTAIRSALQQDQLELATHMLGRPYQICGRVAHGDKRGRTIGFPTANLKLHRHATAVHGVYAVQLSRLADPANGLQALRLNGVANIGKRPTVDGHSLQLEVHLFDFEGELYGQQVCVEFKHKIRDERKFETFDALKQQIIRDSEQASAFFKA